jgi:hypothetical protein
LHSTRVYDLSHSTEIPLASFLRLRTIDSSLGHSGKCQRFCAETRLTRQLAVYHLHISPSELETVPAQDNLDPAFLSCRFLQCLWCLDLFHTSSSFDRSFALFCLLPDSRSHMQCSAKFSPPRERSHLRGFPPEMQTRASQYLAHGCIAISRPLIPGNIPSGDASYRCVPGCTSLAAYHALYPTLLCSRDSADSWRTCVCGCNAPVRLRLPPHGAPSCSNFFFQYDSSQVPRFAQFIYPLRKNACLGSAMSTRLRLLIPTTGAYLAPPAVHKAREWISLNATTGVCVTDCFWQVYSTW